MPEVEGRQPVRRRPLFRWRRLNNVFLTEEAADRIRRQYEFFEIGHLRVVRISGTIYGIEERDWY